MTRIARLASRFALVALACAACRKDADKPPPIWIERSTLDTAPLIAACGPERHDPESGPLEDATARRWGRVVDSGGIDCAVYFKGDRVYVVRLSIHAREAEFREHVDGTLQALLPLLPPDVAELARRMKAGGRDSERRLGDFELQVMFPNKAAMIHGETSFTLWVTHRPTSRREAPRPEFSMRPRPGTE